MIQTIHVIIISIDGLRPDALDLAHTPTLDQLQARGAYSPSAQTVSLSITLPSHASMLTGMTPEKHGILWGLPYIGWPGMAGPTLFNVAHDADDGREGPDVPITGNALEEASAAALEYIGQGRVTETEVGDEEGYYEIEITLDNGRQVDVHLDEAFNVLGHEDD